MAKTLSASVRASATWTHSNTVNLGNALSSSGSVSYSKTFTDGTGAGAANRLYVDELTINASSTTNLDLAGGVTDVFGAAITFARFKVLIVEATTELAGGPVKVGGNATVAVPNWITSADTLDNDQPAVRVRNGGILFLACTDATGYAVTATTADTLDLTNESGSVGVVVNIVIIGEA